MHQNMVVLHTSPPLTAPRRSHGLAAVQGQAQGHGHLRRVAAACQARGVGLAKDGLPSGKLM